MDETCLARSKAAALEHVGPDGEKCFRDRAGSCQLHAGGHGQALRFGGHTIFRVTAADDQRADAIPVPPAFHTVAAGRHDAGHFESGNIAGAGRRRIFALALHQVGTIHAGRRDANQRFSSARLRNRQLNRLQHVRAARMGNGYSEHVISTQSR